MLLSCSAYISTARRLSPTVPRELEEYIASAYSSIRQEEAKSTTPHSYTTIRTLLSILRISAVSVYFSSPLFTCYNEGRRVVIKVILTFVFGANDLSAYFFSLLLHHSKCPVKLKPSRPWLIWFDFKELLLIVMWLCFKSTI